MEEQIEAKEVEEKKVKEFTDIDSVLLISIYNEFFKGVKFRPNSVKDNIVRMTRERLIRNGHKHRIK